MEGILKYQRIQGAFDNIFERDHITAAAIETNFLVVGAESGSVYILSFVGQLRHHFKPHQAPVNSISLFYDGALTVLSCSDDGDVVLTSLSQDEPKDCSFQFDLPIKTVAFEETRQGAKKGQLSFLAGAINGALIYRKGGWLKQKTHVLSPGSGTMITDIRWRRSLVAWADLTTVRLMDISTQTAICRVAAPHGVLPDDGIFCRLMFRSDQELLIAWGASFKVLHIEAASDDSKAIVGSGYHISATTVVEWYTDSIISAFYTFDREHICLLCYSPPDEESSSSVTCEPEMVIANMKTGHVVYSAVLPLRGTGMGGPVDLFFLSSYSCADSASDADKWSLSGLGRGGDRGLAPLFFVLSPQDAVTARFRDVNDRIVSALQGGFIKQAVEVAAGDRSALRAFSFHDLFLLYVDSLASRQMASLAAKECARLIGPDAALWEKAVDLFKRKDLLRWLCDCVPTENPRLAETVYEDILYVLLSAGQVELFSAAVKRWAPISSPPLFPREKLLAVLSAINTNRTDKLSLVADSRLDLSALQSSSGGARLPLIEAEAALHLAAKNWDRVLSCYLDSDFSAASALESVSSTNEYKNVFDLIETNNLFAKVEAKIANLIRLSQPLSGRLLVSHVDKLPIRKIASSLQNDPPLLHWYLHLVCWDPLTCQEYAVEEAYGDLHVRQLQLYIDMAPVVLLRGEQPEVKRDRGLEEPLDMEDVQYYRRNCFHSDIISFVRKGYSSYETAIRLCETRNPPLYLEIVMLLLYSSEVKRGLTTILDELGNVALAIEYIEFYYDTMQRDSKQLARQGLRLTAPPTTPLGDSPSSGPQDPVKQHYIELWDELIRFVLKKEIKGLGVILDYLSYCHIDPYLIVRALRPGLSISHLKQRISNIMSSLNFQKSVDVHTKNVLQKESVNLIAQKNHGQRRAVKLSSQLRCKHCMRPLLFEPPAFQAPSSTTAPGTHLLPVAKDYIQIWGSRAHGPGPQGPQEGATPQQYFGLEGAVIFNNKLAFHRKCYDRIN